MTEWGIPAIELHCPTCGAQFTDFNLRSDPVEWMESVLTISPVIISSHTPWYILCPNGHKWTIKTIWRSMNEPDSVLLDRYIGEA